MKKVSEIDWARLAMAIDTDGGITIDKVTCKNGSPKYTLDFYLVNTDKRFLDWTKSTFGGWISMDKKHEKPKWKPTYHWYTKGTSAYKLILQIRKYLIVKSEQADIALQFWQRCTKLTKHSGVKGRPIWMVKRQEDYYQVIKKLNKRGL